MGPTPIYGARAEKTPKKSIWPWSKRVCRISGDIIMPQTNYATDNFVLCKQNKQNKILTSYCSNKITALYHLMFCRTDKLTTNIASSSSTFGSMPTAVRCCSNRRPRTTLSKMTFFVRPESPISSKFLIFVQVLLSYCRLINLQIDKFYWFPSLK